MERKGLPAAAGPVRSWRGKAKEQALSRVKTFPLPVR